MKEGVASKSVSVLFFSHSAETDSRHVQHRRRSLRSRRYRGPTFAPRTRLSWPSRLLSRSDRYRRTVRMSSVYRPTMLPNPLIPGRRIHCRMSECSSEIRIDVQGECLVSYAISLPESTARSCSMWSCPTSSRIANRRFSKADTERTWVCLIIMPLFYRWSRRTEGPWSQVCKAIHDCHAAVHAMGAPRIATDVRIGTRTDRELVHGDGNEHKVRRVKEILASRT